MPFLCFWFLFLKFLGAALIVFCTCDLDLVTSVSRHVIESHNLSSAISKGQVKRKATSARAEAEVEAEVLQVGQHPYSTLESVELHGNSMTAPHGCHGSFESFLEWISRDPHLPSDNCFGIGLLAAPFWKGHDSFLEDL